MFVGHYAVAFAGKRWAPCASLGNLIGAAILLDLLWPLFLLLGWERFSVGQAESPFLAFRFDHYPWSHSLLAAAFWAAVAAGLYQWRTRYAAGARVVGVLVLSHWVLDLVVHRPDLPITPWTRAAAGLGLWASPMGTMALELLMLALGFALYLRAVRPLDRVGAIGPWVLLAILLVSYAATSLASADPAAGVAAVALVGLAGGLLTVVLGWWFDRRREPVACEIPGA